MTTGAPCSATAAMASAIRAGPISSMLSKVMANSPSRFAAEPVHTVVSTPHCRRMASHQAAVREATTQEMQAEMRKIEDCLHCGQCAKKCPYGLPTPELLEKNYEDYKKVLAGEVTV